MMSKKIAKRDLERLGEKSKTYLTPKKAVEEGGCGGELFLAIATYLYLFQAICSYL